MRLQSKATSRIRLSVLCALLAFAACTTAGRRQVLEEPTERSGGVRFLIAGRTLDRDWEPLEDHTAIGLELDAAPPPSVLGFELGVSGSRDDIDDLDGTGIGVELSVIEAYVGPRLTLQVPESPVYAFLGMGPTVITGEFEADFGPVLGTASTRDTTAAFYAHGGLLVVLGEALEIGFDLRTVVGADIELEGVDAELDYTQIGAFVGLSF